MSASLVGSEMCIRDRPSEERHRWDRASGGSFGGLPEPAHHWGRCQQPVSYTHLTLPTICSV
eukprot:3309764-Alexandrium_andersonii.AAC.1